MAMKEFTVYAFRRVWTPLYQWLAERSPLDEYFDAVVELCHAIRHHRVQSPDELRDMLKGMKEYQRSLAQPMHFFLETLPQFRRVRHVQPLPSIVLRLVPVFRREEIITPCTRFVMEADIDPVYRSGYLYDRTLLEAIWRHDGWPDADKVIELLHLYYIKESGHAPFTKLLRALDLPAYTALYSCCYAAHLAISCYALPIPRDLFDHQLTAIYERTCHTPSLVQRCATLLACPSCKDIHSMVSLYPSSAAHAHSELFKRRANQKARSVAGFPHVIVDIGTGKLYCGRKNGKTAEQCHRTQLVEFSLLGQCLCLNGKFYTICAQPGCGGITQWDPHAASYTPYGPACISCTMDV